MRRVAAIVVALTAALSGGGNAAAQPIATIEVEAGAFEPMEVRVDPGGTVTWVVREGGHTIQADDGRFAYPGGRGTAAAGDSYSFTVGQSDEAIGYFCSVHGRPTADTAYPYPRCGMCGFVLVGQAKAPIQTPPPAPAPVTRHVPSDYPTISAALADAPARTVVRVASGVYRESLRVTARGVTISGAPDGSTIIEGDRSRSAGVFVSSDDVRLEDLVVRNFVDDGVVWLGVDGFSASRVSAVDNGARGFLARRSRGGSIEDALATGAVEAGFTVQDCIDCDVVFSRLEATASGIGFLARNAGGIILRDSALHENATGVLLGTRPQEKTAPRRGAHVWGNDIADNNRPAPPGSAAVSGVGVLVSGGWFDVIERNDVVGHDRFGVVVTGAGGPAYGDRVIDNVIVGSPVSRADLAWDGIGMNVCFDGNTAASHEPPFAQMFYSCSRPLTFGILWPPVLTELYGPGQWTRNMT